MTTRTVKCEVTAGGGVAAYWIAVNGEPVELIDGKGTMKLNSDESHMLVWTFLGNPGSTLKITGKNAGTTVVEVKRSKIPPGKVNGAGAKRFSV